MECSLANCRVHAFSPLGALAFRLLFFGVFPLLTLPCSGLPADKGLSQFVHDEWGLREGLPQISVQAVTQTKDGYLWLGTQEGLVRFDGVGMTIYDQTGPRGLPDTFINGLFADREGRLWIGTRQGPAFYWQGQIRNFFNRDGYPGGAAYTFAQTPDGTVWIAGDHGVTAFNRDGFKHFGKEEGLPSESVRCLLVSQRGTLWAGTLAGPVFFDGSRFVRGERMDALSELRIAALLESEDGSIWFGSDQGLHRFNQGELIAYSREEGLPAASVLSLSLDNDGVVWVGSGAGLVRIHEGRVLDDHTFDGHTSGLQVLSLFSDHEGNMWVGTYSHGLHRLRDGLLTPLGRPEGLPHESVRALMVDKNKRLWIGTEGGLVRLLRDGGVATEGKGLSNNRIQCLYQDERGVVWVGTRYGGLNKQVAGGWEHKPLTEDEKGLQVRAVIGDGRGGLWVGAFERGLFHIDAEGRVSLAPFKLRSNLIYNLFLDRQKRLWIGYRGEGLDLVDNGEVRKFGLADGLSGGTVYSFYQAENNDVWVGTNGGLTRFRNLKTAVVTTEKGLFNNVVYALLEVNGDMWMSCNKGIFTTSLLELNMVLDGAAEQVSCRNFGIGDGMRSRECNFAGPSSAALSPSGALWFPTVKGAVSLNPRQIKINHYLPPVELEAVVVDQVTRLPYETDVFEAGVERIEFLFTALSLTDPGKVRFRYFLEGYDKDWSEEGRDRKVSYTNLPPRTYTFKVIASNNDGLWNQDGVSYTFRIKPLIYQTRWFWLVVGVLLIVAVYGVVRLRIANHLQREKRLQSLVAARTDALVHSNRELVKTQEQLVQAAHQAGMAEITTNILHNLGNALNSVNVTSSVIGKDLRELKIEFLEKLAKLVSANQDNLSEFVTHDARGKKIPEALNAVADALSKGREALLADISALDEQILRMNDLIRKQHAHINVGGFYEPVELQQMIPQIVSMQRKKLERYEVDVIYELEPLERVRIQKSKMVQVLIHVLNNAFEAIQMSEKENGHRLAITLRRAEDGMVELSVRDSGIGVEPDALEQIFYHGYSTKNNQTGFGLHYCANAMMEMKGSVRAFSDGSEHGTLIVLRFPFTAAET